MGNLSSVIFSFFAPFLDDIKSFSFSVAIYVRQAHFSRTTNACLDPNMCHYTIKPTQRAVPCGTMPPHLNSLILVLRPLSLPVFASIAP